MSEARMKFPHLFMQIHQRELEDGFYKHGPVFRIIAREPLGAVTLDPIGDAAEMTVTPITIRCINDRGVVRMEASSKEDLKVATEWAEKHRNTPPEAFDWLPSL